jgi:hypothetical protein
MAINCSDRLANRGDRKDPELVVEKRESEEASSRIFLKSRMRVSFRPALELLSLIRVFCRVDWIRGKRE